jgi:hypothetical protein
MTIEETLKVRLHNYYLEVLTNAREDKHPDTKQYADIFSIYCKCILDACSDLCGASEEMRVYAAELKEALTREVAFLERQHDLKVARQGLESLKQYRGLSELLTVLNNDDLLYVYKHSRRAASTFIDDIEDFYDIIEKMQIKYNLRVNT